MDNKKRQKNLDKRKWLNSEKENRDLSGKMNYCMYCRHSGECANCLLSQDNREDWTVCATAYNRMIRRRHEEKIGKCHE